MRTFAIPGSVDQTKIGAEYKDGVLSIALPKQEEQQARRVEIKIS
jgi:HSP20 family protein